jgi:integration host factor subunit beta
MTRSDLIERLSNKHSVIPVQDVEQCVKEVFDLLSDSLCEGERIEVRGFGSFSLRYREPRIGRNPKTGDKVDLGGKYVPHFKAGKDMKDRVDAINN